MYRYAVLKRAPQKGALFAFWLFLLFSVGAYAENCLPFKADEWVTVTHVHDGDTIRLKDGRKVRLIGINTPELARENRPAEPLGVEAKEVLYHMIAGQRVALKFGVEKKDRYGRLLAHIYLENGRSVQELLLEKGLAAFVAVAPNIKNSLCYRDAEQRAHGQGIWRHALFQPVDVKQLRSEGGFRIVEGSITRVGNSSKALWLNFENNFSVRIAKRDMKNFGINLNQLVGKKVRVRGWISKWEGKLQMRVFHPVALEVLD